MAITRLLVIPSIHGVSRVVGSMLGKDLHRVHSINTPYFTQIRNRTGKHWNPTFKKLRGLKVIKLKLPDYSELDRQVEEMTKEELRSKMKEKGIMPERPWMESSIYISCTGGIFEPYVPPEGDGKLSPTSAKGAKQKLEFVEKKGKSMMALRKVRSFEEDFEYHSFLNLAEDIYIKAHNVMTIHNKKNLMQYITEHAYPEVIHNIGDKTVFWNYLAAIEPAKIVQIRCTDVISKDNIFGQITVRFHSKQMLAVYDRFGRLVHGSKSISKDVLEYIVFEKHLSNQYGTWRIHSKILPDWMPPSESPKRTYRNYVNS